MTTGVLVIDAGTSGVRAAVVCEDGSITTSVKRPALPSSPMEGFVEFDPVELRDVALAVAGEALDRHGMAVTAVGITNQRASTVLWERATGLPLGPGVSWQDLRTAGMCLLFQSEGLRLAPNASATKLAFLLDLADPGRSRSTAGELAFGTVDCWLAWNLSGGVAHVTDATNACVTGLLRPDASGWDEAVLQALRIPPEVMPRIAESAEVIGEAQALPGAPPIAGLAGDQQASLLGQGCVARGAAKATFGTGGMLDLCVGRERPRFSQRGPAGTVPLVAFRLGGETTWCVEAIALSAGVSVEWLRDGLGLIRSAAESEEVAASVPDSGEVAFVPSFLGTGAPRWDFGARGAFLGISRKTTRAHLVRAVLEGVAQRGADLLDAAEADTGLRVERLRVDGGMSINGIFVQALADFCGRPLEVSAIAEATTLGAAFLAGIATGVWRDQVATAELARVGQVVEPRLSERARVERRARWRGALERAGGWVPELSGIDF